MSAGEYANLYKQYDPSIDNTKLSQNYTAYIQWKLEYDQKQELFKRIPGAVGSIQPFAQQHIYSKSNNSAPSNIYIPSKDEILSSLKTYIQKRNKRLFDAYAQNNDCEFIIGKTLIIYNPKHRQKTKANQ